MQEPALPFLRPLYTDAKKAEAEQGEQARFGYSACKGIKPKGAIPAIPATVCSNLPEIVDVDCVIKVPASGRGDQIFDLHHACSRTP
ncbi:MAG: hypothetical protein RKP46_05380 [Candidatus Accumulibacter sp.]|uniref:hypothetical protein n=1 Tax=Accumulibacter sp. TaxID=2053492 RepID=UPI00287A0850|nr:hypothetical protein [Accumulibacter sp.]MDS4013774.1 hypothetical protein [Accumulibacter sp.]